MPPFASTNSGGWGSSWKVYILPDIEQGALYSKWQWTGSSGFSNTNNNTLVANLTLSVYRCPSSPTPDFGPTGNNGGGQPQMTTTYTGIAGAPTGNLGSDYYNCRNAGSFVAFNGVLYSQSQVKLTSISDGTSNTWMVGEQSNYLRDTNGNPVAGYTGLVGNSTPDYGWIMGSGQGTQTNAQYAGNDGRHYSCTTVRYNLNQIGFTTNEAADQERRR